MATGIRPAGSNGASGARRRTRRALNSGTATDSTAPVWSTWDDNDVADAIRKATPEEATANAKFMAGDHWQERAGWIGPHPATFDSKATEVWAEIEKSFVSRNAIAEVVERHVSGVVGQEPMFALTVRRALKQDEEPTEEEQALIDEAEAALTIWWNARNMGSFIQRTTAQMLWASRSVTRLYVPPALVERVPPSETEGDAQNDAQGEGGNGNGSVVESAPTTIITARTLGEALSKIHVMLPQVENATVVTDADTADEAGVYQEKDKAGRVNVELTYLATRPSAATTEVGEDGSVTDVRPTVIRVMRDGEVFQTELPLGGRLTMHEERRDLLVTRQVQQSQRALNLALSMVPRNVVTGAFLERVILNAQIPGDWIPDATAPGGEKFVPDPYLTGNGTTNFLVGVEQKDALTGQVTRATPEVVWRPPVEVTAPVSARDAHYEDILAETKQAHILISADATASGKSRIEARADFEKSLLITAQREQSRGIWLIETALAMAEAFLGEPGRYTGTLRATYECRIDTGPLDANEMAAITARVNEGMLTRETGMQLQGVTDVDAEMERMASDPRTRLALLKDQASVVNSLESAGVDLEAALKIVGMDEEDMRLILSTRQDLNPPEAETALRARVDAKGSPNGASSAK